MKPKNISIWFTALVAGWCALIVVAPLAASLPATEQFSRFIYRLFSSICHQLDERSFHVAGNKLGVCIRCSSIYFGFFFSLIALQFAGRKEIPALRFLILGSLPMLIDVAMNLAGVHESTTWTRLISGATFGGALAFFIVPPIFEAFAQFQSPSFSQRGINARKTE